MVSQQQGGRDRVIAYFSKTLSKAEWKNCVTRRELLAVANTLEYFHKYLYGQEFHLRSDHSALTWLLSFKKAGRTDSPMGQASAGVKFHIRAPPRQAAYERGRPFRASMPRGMFPLPKVERRADDHWVRVVSVSADGWDRQALREQLVDDLGPLIREHEAGRRPQWRDICNQSPKHKSYWAQWKFLALADVLVSHWE